MSDRESSQSGFTRTMALAACLLTLPAFITDPGFAQQGTAPPTGGKPAEMGVAAAKAAARARRRNVRMDPGGWS